MRRRARAGSSAGGGGGDPAAAPPIVEQDGEFVVVIRPSLHRRSSRGRHRARQRPAHRPGRRRGGSTRRDRRRRRPRRRRAAAPTGETASRCRRFPKTTTPVKPARRRSRCSAARASRRTRGWYASCRTGVEQVSDMPTSGRRFGRWRWWRARSTSRRRRRGGTSSRRRLRSRLTRERRSATPLRVQRRQGRAVVLQRARASVRARVSRRFSIRGDAARLDADDGAAASASALLDRVGGVSGTGRDPPHRHDGAMENPLRPNATRAVLQRHRPGRARFGFEQAGVLALFERRYVPPAAGRRAARARVHRIGRGAAAIAGAGQGPPPRVARRGEDRADARVLRVQEGGG